MHIYKTSNSKLENDRISLKFRDVAPCLSHGQEKIKVYAPCRQPDAKQ